MHKSRRRRRSQGGAHGSTAHAGQCDVADREGLTFGKAPPDRPAFQPYWGKPAVRNERGDRGNVGSIRSPVRASILPNTRRLNAHRVLSLTVSFLALVGWGAFAYAAGSSASAERDLRAELAQLKANHTNLHEG